MADSTIVFIGGGNMASAMLGGLIDAGRPASSLRVVEPFEEQRKRLQQRFGIDAVAAAGPSLAQAALVVWAVKPQLFSQAAAPCAAHVAKALQLSVMAGIRSDTIVRATGSRQVVRAMPNTPALIGQGIAGLFASATVTAAQKAVVEQVLAPTGKLMWFEREADLDAVTAISGSGPAYVFYVVEAMMEAAQQMGLSAEQGRQLALGTFSGAAALATQSDEAPSLLRQRVTSKGGTTHAAISALEAAGVKAAFIDALLAAQQRARELGDEFGAPQPDRPPP
jgi:pyrroline-5-carboxylate reductase